MKFSKFVLSCAVSPEKITSCDPGPKTATNASWPPAFAASANALAASSGDANVFCAASVAAGFSGDLLHEAKEITRARSTTAAQHREIMTLTCDIPILQTLYFMVDGQVFCCTSADIQNV